MQLIHEYEREVARKEDERLRRISWWEQSGSGSEVMAEPSAASLFQLLLQNGCSALSQMKLLRKAFPDLPRHLAVQVVCEPTYDPFKVPYNRRVRRRLFDPQTPTLVHLFSGEQCWKDCTGQVLGVELKAGSDLLSDDIFGKLVQAASSGCVDGCIAGPPCRTVSACRCKDDGGPRVIRGRHGMERYGLPTNTAQEQSTVDADTILWFRSMLLFLIVAAYAPSKPYLGWEHPDDPACWSEDPKIKACPSVWQFPEMQLLQRLLGAWIACFDQGPLGHVKRKPTAFLCTSWSLYESLHGVRGPGSSFKPSRLALSPGYESQRWAVWAPDLVQAVKRGWSEHVASSESHRLDQELLRRQQLRALSPQWQAHVEADHVPYRRDCEVCLQAASRGRAHLKQDHAAFYALSSDICGPFSPGADVGKVKKYFVVYTIKIPVGSNFPWQDVAKDPRLRARGPTPLSGHRSGEDRPVPSVSEPPVDPAPTEPACCPGVAVGEDFLPPMHELFGEEPRCRRACHG